MIWTVLYLILLIGMFFFTWAAISIVYSELKELKKANDVCIEELKQTLDGVLTIQNSLSKCLENVAKNEDTAVDVINNCLRNIDNRIDELNVTVLKRVVEPIENKPAKKGHKKKSVETREDLETL